MTRLVLLTLALISATACFAQQDARRVFITDNKGWYSTGVAGGSDGSFGARSVGGSVSDNLPLIQGFVKQCPGIIVTQNKDNADYVVLFEGNHTKKAEASTAGLVGLVVLLSAKYEQIAVFRGNGDILFTGNTRHLKNAVKDACSSVMSAPMVARIAPVPVAPSTQTVVVRVETVAPTSVSTIPPVSVPVQPPAAVPQTIVVAAPAEPSLGDIARQYQAKKAQGADQSN
jgi:hypothetical protein